MGQRTLGLALSCENYDTGASANINYAEERSKPELVEQFSPEASGATRTFYTAWSDRFNFLHSALGFAKVNPSGTDGIAADGTGFNGKHVHRRSPWGYCMGRLATGEPSDWVYATRAVVVPDGVKQNYASPTSVYLPGAEYAKITVSFSALEYDLATDLSIFFSGSAGAGPYSGMREWLRFTRIVQKPASIFFQFPGQALKLVDYPTSGLSQPAGIPINVIDNIADFWVFVYDLPYDPIVGVNKCFGKVNKFAAFATPDFPTGQPAETLHLIAADIQRLPLRFGQKYWNLILGFRKVFNRNHAGVLMGHNQIRYVVNEGGNPRLRFFRVSADGTTDISAGNPMIDLEDFIKIFWID